MITPELREIASALLKKARANEVNWVPAADLGLGKGSEDVVISFPEYSINIYRQDQEDDYLITFSILNEIGKYVDGFTLHSSEPDFGLLEELLSLAKKKVSGADEAISFLLKAVAQPGVLGTPAKIARQNHDDDLPF